MIQFTRRSVALVLLATASICAWGTDVNISVTFNSSNKPQNGITLSKDAVDYGTVSCNTASSNRAIIRNTSSLTIAATKIGWTVKSIALTWRGSSNDPTSTDVLTITGGSFNSLTSITGSSASVVIGSGSTNNNYQVSAVSVTFTDGGGGDVTPPTLVSSSPANNATGVAVSGNIKLTFSENVTVNDASKFTLSGGAGSLTTASISASDAVVTIPYSGLTNSTSYTLSVAANAVKDGSNNMNAALSNISFTTAAASCTSITPTFSTDYTSLTLTVGEGNSSTPAINKDGSEGGITWSSSAEGVATVSNTGVVSPVSAGTARITATIAAAGGKCEGSVYRDFTINAASGGGGGDCEEIFAGQATDKSTFTPSVGSATTALASNGGDSFSAGGYSYSVKPNSTNALIASPEAGEAFAEGDSLIVVVYNNNSGAKNMGFKLGSGTYTTSVPGSTLYVFRQLLAASDISDGKVTFNRQSSDDRWVAITIKRCNLCSEATPSASATKTSVELGDAITFSVTGYEDGATLQWQKQNSSTKAWENIAGKTSATFEIASAVAGDAGTYRVVAHKTCDKASNKIVITIDTGEDCAAAGNEGEAEFGFVNTDMSSGTYDGKTCWSTNSTSKYVTYTSPEGKMFASMKATIANKTADANVGYAYSTDGGTSWTGVTITGMTTSLTERSFSLPANVNAIKMGRKVEDCGSTSGTFYLSNICFTYTELCTKTSVTPSEGVKNHTIGNSFTAPTFTVKHSSVAFTPQPSLTYTSSDESIATVNSSGVVTFHNKGGSVKITASFAGGNIDAVEYCASDGSYTINVSCDEEAPRVVANEGTNLGGCNESITILAKKQDGTTDFASGSYQWYRNGVAIEGATSKSYEVKQAGEFTVSHTTVGGCEAMSSNSATVTSDAAEPSVQRLVPLQYYHNDGRTYTDFMKMRHLFAVQNSGIKDGKSYKMEMKKNGGAATDVTNSGAFSMNVDTVMIDLNKMSELSAVSNGDKLLLTCYAIDCSGNVSDTYKDTVGIYIIDGTPTLALILDGNGSNLGLGFFDYNTNNLKEGNTSSGAEWTLYTKLKTAYKVIPVNGYAEFNKLNYEPYDIIFLTDFPKASKHKDKSATILDNMAELCDFRPLFTFKTHMVAKSPSKWAAKGFTTEPVAVTKGDGRLYMNIVCFRHPMFETLKTGADVYTDNSDETQLVYKMLTEPGTENSKGIQGFEIDAAENFVTIGLIHYSGTAKENNPSSGKLTWVDPGRLLVAAAERQANMEARMILLSLNVGAHSKLTTKGQDIVMKCLEYLLSDPALVKPADCSLTFDNKTGDHKWSNAGNWGPEYNQVPGEYVASRVAAAATIDIPRAKALEVRLLEGGTINIPAGSGLEVRSTIRRWSDGLISPTEKGDITIGSELSGNGTLIFNNNTGDTKAKVSLYSKAFVDHTTDPSKEPKGIKNYQYIGTPFTSVNAIQYYNAWLYSWTGAKWAVVPNGGTMNAWMGYCISQENEGTVYDVEGTLAATGTIDISVPGNGDMVVGNSWTAPIDINALQDEDFENLQKNVYFFNTGVDKNKTGAAASTRYEAGKYITVPIHSAPYTEDDRISSQQGFFVTASGSSAGTLHLDYDKHVRKTTRPDILSGEMHAPSRRMTSANDEPEVMKIKVSGENYDDLLVLLAREDFTDGLDEGWDGDKWDGNAESMFLYTKDERGVENSVSAVPDMEGTVIGFRAGEDDEYTMYFERLNSEEKFYLYDMDMNIYTQIADGAAYHFATSDKDKHDRFIITRRNPNVATGMESASDSLQGGRVKKLKIGDQIYILRAGVLYDMTGKHVQLNRKEGAQ